MLLELLALALVLFVPGLLLSCALVPHAGSLRFSERLLLSLMLGALSATALGLLLANLTWPGVEGQGALRAGPLWVGFGALVVVAAIAAHRAGCQWRELARSAVRQAWSPSSATALVILGATLAAHGWRQHGDPHAMPVVSWYYLGDILEIARRGLIPLATVDYGVAMNFEVNKISWYLPVAEWIAMTGTFDEPWRVMHAWTLVMIGCVGLGAWVMCRSLTRSLWAAALGTVLILWLSNSVYKLHGFRGEPLAMAWLFAWVWLLHRRRAKQWRWELAITSCVTLLLTTHLVPAAVAGMWTVAFMAVSAPRRGDARVLRRLGGAAVVGLVASVLIWAAAGNHPLEGQRVLGEPEMHQPFEGLDPTHAFERQFWGIPAVSRYVKSYQAPDEARFYIAPGELLEELGTWAEIPLPVLPSSVHVVLVPAVLLLLCALGWRHRDSRDVALAMPLFALLLYAWGLWFIYTYHTYLPALHGSRREFMYLQLFVVVLLAVAADSLMGWLADRSPGWLSASGAAILAAACAAAPLAKGWERLNHRTLLASRVSEHGMKAYAWIEENTPPGARFVADGASAGIFHVLSGRVSLTEGRAPYFQPANLRAANETLAHARDALRSPRKGARWLREADVDYVLTGSKHLGMLPMRPYRTGTALRRLGRVKHAASLGPVQIYRVTR